MIVYSATKQRFLQDNNDREIDEVYAGIAVEYDIRARLAHASPAASTPG